MTKIVKLIAGATLVTVIAGMLGGCYVESRGRWRPYHHRPVVMLR
ncbi:MAG TPA: hypothetical protein VGF94_19455 [Kofleriaceae bacterium]|jgi:hypothetical protein